MKTQNAPTKTTRKTYLGQPARIICVATLGRTLYALKTCATKPVATAWDIQPLLRIAASAGLVLSK